MTVPAGSTSGSATCAGDTRRRGKPVQSCPRLTPPRGWPASHSRVTPEPKERGWRRVVFAAALAAGAALVPVAPVAADPALEPGRYQVEVRISLPNVAVVAPALNLTRCIGPDDLLSGEAFSVLSDNPLRTCGMVDYQTTQRTASYRIECAGPNRGYAIAAFDVRPNSYRGTIKMNMGGKNMTMAETQVGKRIGDCR